MSVQMASKAHALAHTMEHVPWRRSPRAPCGMVRWANYSHAHSHPSTRMHVCQTPPPPPLYRFSIVATLPPPHFAHTHPQYGLKRRPRLDRRHHSRRTPRRQRAAQLPYPTASRQAVQRRTRGGAQRRRQDRLLPNTATAASCPSCSSSSSYSALTAATAAAGHLGLCYSRLHLL